MLDFFLFRAHSMALDTWAATSGSMKAELADVTDDAGEGAAADTD